MNMNMNRWLGLGGLAVAAMLLLTLLSAPQSGQAGSTYSRAPDGYGAWYAYMQAQQQPVQRWQRPLSDLWPDLEPPPLPPVQQVASPQITQPITLIRVDPRGSIREVNRTWIEQGNRLVILGARPAVTDAPFESALESPAGPVTIATSRRHPSPRKSLQTPDLLLFDRFGAVVWREAVGQGEVIRVATPHLAANAYQAAPGNFKFLAQLVAASGQPIYIDEFLHGHRDRDAVLKSAQSLPQYLAQTPLLLLAVQAVLLLLVLIWGQRRFGRPQRAIESSPNGNQAYVKAMAEVLQKADCGDFVVQTIGRAEQIRLQQTLGLGSTQLDPQVVIAAWVQQTGRPASELDWLSPIQSPDALRRWRERDLGRWLSQIKTTRH